MQRGDEEIIVRRAQAGEEAAWDILVLRHDEYLHGFIGSLFHNEINDEDDLVQDVWLKAFCALKSFRIESSFKTWITRICVNHVLHFRQTNSRHKDVSLDEPIEEQNLVLGDVLRDKTLAADPLKQAESSETERVILHAVAELPERQRIAFVLRHVNEMKLVEVAHVMDITIAGVKNLLYRAEENLRRWLAESGVLLPVDTSGGIGNGAKGFDNSRSSGGPASNRDGLNSALPRTVNPSQ